MVSEKKNKNTNNMIAASCGSHEVTIRWHSLKHFFFFLTYTVKQVFALDNSFQFFFFFENWFFQNAEVGSNLIELASTTARALKEKDDQVYCQPELLYEGKMHPLCRCLGKGQAFVNSPAASLHLLLTQRSSARTGTHVMVFFVYEKRILAYCGNLGQCWKVWQ